MLVRMGFVAGMQDGELAQKLYGEGDPHDVFGIGPELHAFEGAVKATIIDSKIDWARGTFFGEVTLDNSWEAESHIQQFGVGDDPVCWTIVGFASGYCSQFFKRFIVFREVECVGKGDSRAVCSSANPPKRGARPTATSITSAASTPCPFLQQENELTQLRGSRREAFPHRQAGERSTGFRAAFDLVSKAATSPINVLLLGETGVGKEMFARWLHDHSDRAGTAIASFWPACHQRNKPRSRTGQRMRG